MDYRRRYAGRILAGLFLLVAGAVLLLHQQGLFIPNELYNWHLFVAALGLFIGFARAFRGFGWMVIMGVGAVGLVQDYYPGIHLDAFIWPGLIILIGLALIFRRKRPWDEEWVEAWHQRRHQWHAQQRHWHEQKREWRRQARRQWKEGARNWQGAAQDWHEMRANAQAEQHFVQDEYIDTTNGFSSLRKKMLSKNFKGGHVTTFLGSMVVDLSEADINGNVQLNITQIMGSTKIIVPADWEVRSEANVVMAGFEDKREQPAVINPAKVLVIQGEVVMGSIEVQCLTKNS